MKKRLSNGMQVFARAMVAPVFFLPIVGILIALSSILSNPTIVGGGGATIGFGKFIAGGLWPIMNNLSLIFCVAIAMGLAKEKKAEAALVAVFTYLVFLGANHEWLAFTDKLVKYTNTSDLYGTGQTLVLGFQVIDMGVFLGMILGIVVALAHNRFCNKELPGAFAIYGNTKLVFTVLVPVMLVLAMVLSYVWPVIASGIGSATHFIEVSGSVGVFLYGFLNRFLIPTGLHHLIWSPFSYSNLGGELTINGTTYMGAVNIFYAQLTDPSIGLFDPSAKYLQYGMVKMFGLLGAALAFYNTAKPENKTKLKAILIPAAATSALVGITEPLEFTFLFVSPFLWLVHSVMDGLFEAVAVMLGVRTYGSGGFIDFFVANLPAGIGRTKWPIFLAVGLVQVGVYFVIFKLLITKLKLKTPGREDSADDVKLFTKKDYKEKVSASSGEVAVGQLSAPPVTDLAETIVRALGGRANIEAVDNCFTRLRVTVQDAGQVDETALKGTGAVGVIINGMNIQVVYGPKVTSVRSSVDKFLAG